MNFTKKLKQSKNFDISRSKVKNITLGGYINFNFLCELGFNSKTLSNHLSKNKQNKTKNYTFHKDSYGNKWILLSSIPQKNRKKYNIDFSEEEIKLFTSRYKEELLSQNKHKAENNIHFILFNAWNDENIWTKYNLYYKDYMFDNDIRNLFSKTHSLFLEILTLKKSYKLSDILTIYQRFDKAVFQTQSYTSFSRKLRLAESKSIADALVHDFKRFGREPYLLTSFIKKRIEYYYALPVQNSCKQITNKLNEELINRKLKTVSYSLVNKYTKTPYVQNRCNPSRYGKEFAENNIYPSITRTKHTRHVGEVLQIDASPINFLVTNGETKEEFKIWLCVISEVYSRKIIGFSFDTSENTEMIIDCLKMALKNLRAVPKQIVHDAHKAYSSEKYIILKQKLSEYGVTHRQCSPKNPKDKGHVESFFKTLKQSYLSNEIGYLGQTIQSVGQRGRVNTEIEQLYKKKAFKKTDKEVKALVKDKISEYNNTIRPNEKESPNAIFKSKFPKDQIVFEKGSLSYLFHKETSVTVRQSKVTISINKKKFYYTIDNLYLQNKLNTAKVRVRYDYNNLEKIDVFDLNSDKYITTLIRDNEINILADDNDKKEINKHYQKLKSRIYKNIDALRSDIDDGWEELKSHPVVNIEYDEILETKNHYSNITLLNKTYPSNLKRVQPGGNSKQKTKPISFYKEI